MKTERYINLRQGCRIPITDVEDAVRRKIIDEFVCRFEYHLRNATFTLGQTNDIQYALKKATEEMKGGDRDDKD